MGRNRAPFNKISAAQKKQDEVRNDYLVPINALYEYTHARNDVKTVTTKDPLQNKVENLGLVVRGLVFGLFASSSTS